MSCKRKSCRRYKELYRKMNEELEDLYRALSCLNENFEAGVNTQNGIKAELKNIAGCLEHLSIQVTAMKNTPMRFPVVPPPSAPPDDRGADRLRQAIGRLNAERGAAGIDPRTVDYLFELFCPGEKNETT